MRRHGYATEPVPMQGAARIAYSVVRRPGNWLRMAGWRAREWLYDRVGRAPNADTMAEIAKS